MPAIQINVESPDGSTMDLKNEYDNVSELPNGSSVDEKNANNNNNTNGLALSVETPL